MDVLVVITWMDWLGHCSKCCIMHLRGLIELCEKISIDLSLDGSCSRPWDYSKSQWEFLQSCVPACRVYNSKNMDADADDKSN